VDGGRRGRDGDGVGVTGYGARALDGVREGGARGSGGRPLDGGSGAGAAGGGAGVGQAFAARDAGGQRARDGREGEAAFLPGEGHAFQREDDAGEGEEDEGLRDGDWVARGGDGAGECAQFSRQGIEGLGGGGRGLLGLRVLGHGKFYN
jgi:hypothetical protein